MGTSSDFQPLYKWHKEKTRNTLQFHLEGFEREQLQILINNLGVLTITGERRVNEGLQIRFKRGFKIPTKCKVNDIQVNFGKGILYVSLPNIAELSSMENENFNYNASTPSPPRLFDLEIFSFESGENTRWYFVPGAAIVVLVAMAFGAILHTCYD